MIFGIGVDIVKVHRMQKNIEQYNERFAHKILCEKEMLEYNNISNPAHYLAKHFAAKEAFVKALGSGFRNGISLRDIGIEHEENGRPVFHFDNKIIDQLTSNSIISSHLSLSDENEYACAFVILEK